MMLTIKNLSFISVIATGVLLAGCSSKSTNYKTGVDHAGYAYSYPTGYREHVVHYPHSHNADGHYQRYHVYRGNYGKHTAIPHYHTVVKSKKMVPQYRTVKYKTMVPQYRTVKYKTMVPQYRTVKYKTMVPQSHTTKYKTVYYQKVPKK